MHIIVHCIPSCDLRYISTVLTGSSCIHPEWWILMTRSSTLSRRSSLIQVLWSTDVGVFISAFPPSLKKTDGSSSGPAVFPLFSNQIFHSTPTSVGIIRRHIPSTSNGGRRTNYAIARPTGIFLRCFQPNGLPWMDFACLILMVSLIEVSRRSLSRIS